jgi:vacuole morphology and inheritance protein 14
MHDIRLYLDALLPPVLHCLDDPESRVRYYSCESLYNIAKVARGHILRYFNQIFDGLCKLFADVDIDVKNGANLLDRLIKDVVTESESFDVERFIPLLQKYIRRSNPYIRQLLVGAIGTVEFRIVIGVLLRLDYSVRLSARYQYARLAARLFGRPI